MCEIWLDDSGIAYRQTGMHGHIGCEKVNRIQDDGKSLILWQGGVALAAFASPQEADEFVAAVREASHIRER